jgi:exopolysaccharide biosynthesis polyprenyl glycosylphosphotransferase
VVTDLVAITLAMAVAFRLREVLPGTDPAHVPTRHLAVSALSLPLWIAVFAHYRLYRVDYVTERRQGLGQLVHAVGASVAVMALLAFTAKLYVARGWLALTFVTSLVVLTAEREAVRRSCARLRRRGRLLRRVLVVGGNADARDLAATLTADPALGYDVVGFVDDHLAPGPGSPDWRILAPVDATLDTALQSGVQGVIIVATAVGTTVANLLARQLTDAGLQVEVVSSLCDIALERLTLHNIGRFPVLHVERVHRSGWRAVAKRGFDEVVAGVGLVLVAPALLVMALLIKLTSTGPVFYRQQRIGKDGKLFNILKLRTMVVDADQKLAQLQGHNDCDGPLFKMRADPRVTSIGRVLRRYSIDEIPQLWNVLRGDMAVVGPRPALASEVGGWSPQLHQRLRVKPGITGMWQVSGRSDTTFNEYARLDLYYVDNWSLLVDLSILAKTIPAVFRRGAY